MKRKPVLLLLVFALTLGLAVPTVAAGQTFDDVHESYWGYKDIEAVSEAGYMNGIGGGQFAPEMKVSVAQFLTLLGRLVFPEVKVGENDSWYGPYVAKAQETGLLDGSQVNTADVFDEIPRYDMAVVLRAAAKKLGISETQAQASEVTDYPDIPTRYAEAVLTVYGMGLIKGDNAGRFNGASTMTRAEIATVIMRLDRAIPAPLPPTTIPPDAELVPYTAHGWFSTINHAVGRPIDDKETYLPGVPFKVYYTADAGATSILIYEGVTGSKERDYSNHNPFGEDAGEYEFTFELPEDAFASHVKGIYFSAETTLDGQRLVTSDLRTDGRDYKDIQFLRSDVGFTPYRDEWYANLYRNSADHIYLTPPDGEKAKFTYKGYVEGSNFANKETDWRLANFTVQLYLADGTLLGEAVSGTDGTFSMECKVDALDDGFNIENSQYYVMAFGTYDGIEYLYNPGKQTRTLIELQVCDFDGKLKENGAHRVKFFDDYRTDK